MFECLASYGVRPPLLITLTYEDLSHTMHESGNTTTVFKQFSAKTNCAIISLPFVHNHNIESKTNNVEKKTWKSERNRRNSLIKTRYLHAYIHTYQRSISISICFTLKHKKICNGGHRRNTVGKHTHVRKAKSGLSFSPEKWVVAGGSNHFCGGGLVYEYSNTASLFEGKTKARENVIYAFRLFRRTTLLLFWGRSFGQTEPVC